MHENGVFFRQFHQLRIYLVSWKKGSITSDFFIISTYRNKSISHYYIGISSCSQQGLQ